MRNAFAAIALSAILLQTPPSLAAEPTCAPYHELEAKFAKEFGEVPAGGSGLIDGTHAVVIFASPNGETWTAVVVDAAGVACPVMAGVGWNVADRIGTPVGPMAEEG